MDEATLQQQYSIVLKEHSQRLAPLEEQVIKLSDEIKQLTTEFLNKTVALRNALAHYKRVREIEHEIQAIEALGEAMDQRIGGCSKTRGGGFFVGSRFNGYALYSDGRLGVYSNAGRPHDVCSHPETRCDTEPVTIVKKFDYYDAFDIITDLSLPREERIQKLRKMLDEFRP